MLRLTFIQLFVNTLRVTLELVIYSFDYEHNLLMYITLETNTYYVMNASLNIRL